MLVSSRKVPPSCGEGAFSHRALFYRSMDEFLSAAVQFVQQAHRDAEPVMVAVPGDRLGALRQRLGTAAVAEYKDMTRLGRNPGRIVAALRDFADRYPARPVRFVCEPIWAGRTPEEVREAVRHEALTNAALHDRPATALCLYDQERLPAGVIADAERTHPTLTDGGRPTPSGEYADPAVVCADCDEPLPEPPSAERIRFASGQLALVRDFTRDWMREVREKSGVADEEPAERDFLLAVSEAAANSIAHAGGAGMLRLWTQGSRMTAEISDGGRLRDPLAGLSRPGPDSADGGRGLWIIHQLCDLVEIRARETGTTLRLHMGIEPA